jgi:hypothetical protein
MYFLFEHDLDKQRRLVMAMDSVLIVNQSFLEGARLDSLVGLFAVGCQPTAAADPFGLRRSAYALVLSSA